MLAFFLFIIAFYYYLDYRKEKREWKKKVSVMYNGEEKRQSFIVLIGNRFDKSEFAKPLYEKLESSNIPFTPSEYIGALIVSFFGISYLLHNIFNIKFLLVLLFSLLIVEVGRRIIFIMRKGKLKQKMVLQLPEICRTLANATRSGMTLNQGIQLVAQEIGMPAKAEFKKLAYELSLGVEFDTALRQMEKRLDIREFQLFVATLLIQKKAGGNLFAVLDEMSETLEERILLHQEIKTMTAEQRYVAYIVPVIPIFLVLMMNNIVDGFIDPLFSGAGIILLLIFLAGTVGTFLLVRKITNIKV